MVSRNLSRSSTRTRTRSPWRPVALACAAAVACVGAAAWLLHWGGPVAARQRWMQVIENTAPNELPNLLQAIAQRDDSTPLLVDLLNHDRGDIAQSARHAIGWQLRGWQDLSPATASHRVAALAELLASRSVNFRAEGRHLAALLVEEVVKWPMDETAINVAGMLANCEAVLRNDPGPETLLDAAPTGKTSTHLTPLCALPLGTRHATESAFPKWDVPPIVGGGLPTEPYSVMEPPREEEARVADSSSDEPFAPPPAAEPRRPDELYEPLAIPLRLAPLFGEQSDNAAPIRSNQPAAISGGPGYQFTKLDDVELMRHLHDPAGKTLAEEELRRRGFDNLRLEIARRLTHDDPQVRRELANALPHLAGIDARVWLKELAADHDPNVRRVAIAILGTSNDPSVEALLNQIRREENNPQVAELIDGILQRRR